MMGPAIVAAFAIFVAVAAVVTLLSNPGSSPTERRLSRLQTTRSDRSDDMSKVLRTDSGTFPFLRRFVSGSWSERTNLSLRQAGWGLKVSEYLLIRIFIAVIFAVVAGLIMRGSSVIILFVLASAAGGYWVPAFFLQTARSRRIEKVNRQLAETLDLVANALRSGFAFTQAVELAAKQVDAPIRDELLHFLRDVSLGASNEVALQELADRTGSYDLEMMVATILVQRTTGGNLAEIMGNVSDTIKERERIVGEIRALTGSQRLTGFILSIYPIFLALLFLAMAPDIMGVLVTEPVGRVLLGVAATLQVLGIVTIRRILRPEF
jgi:tight adherence protein B